MDWFHYVVIKPTEYYSAIITTVTISFIKFIEMIIDYSSRFKVAS
jgi:hypothetical protein